MLEKKAMGEVSFETDAIDFDANWTKSNNNANGNSDKGDNGTSFACPRCPKLFKTMAKRTAHIRIHDDVDRYACRFCDRKFNVKSNQRRHEKSHSTGKAYKCHICKMDFITQFQRTCHYRLKHPEMPCDDYTNTPRTKNHSSEKRTVIKDQRATKDDSDDVLLPECVYSDDEVAHTEKDQGNQEVITVTILDNDKAKDEYYSNNKTKQRILPSTICKEDQETFCCYSCGLVYSHFKDYRGHYLCRHPDMIEVNSFDKNEFLVRLPEEMSCKYCLRIFYDKDMYHMHMRSSHDNKLYTCPLCPRTFISKPGQERHINEHFDDDDENISMEWKC